MCIVNLKSNKLSYGINKMNIDKFASLFLKLAKTVGITTFHGTAAENIPSIVDRGLLAKNPADAPHASKAVYLTNNFETAARYCGDYDKPIVLEIYISSPKRVNKLQQDPEDMDESLYENYGSETFYSEDIKYLEDKIKEIFDLGEYSSCPIDLPNEIEGFRGFDLYGAIKSKARDYDMNLEEVKVNMKELLPPQDLDYLKISESGRISLLPSVYGMFHQMYYRKDLPAAAIKAVWIPKSKLKEGIADGKEEKSFGRRLVPADIRALQNIINIFVRDFWDGSSIELGDMEDVIEELDDTDTFGLFKESNKWGPSFIDQLKSMRDAFESASEEEREKIKSNFYSELENLDPLDPGEVAGKEIWIRIPTDINSLKEINNLYNIKEAVRSYKNLLKISNNFYNLCKIASEEDEDNKNNSTLASAVIIQDDPESLL